MERKTFTHPIFETTKVVANRKKTPKKPTWDPLSPKPFKTPEKSAERPGKNTKPTSNP